MKSVIRSNKVQLSADDLIAMRDRVVNKDAYIDLLIEWIQVADKRVIELLEENRALQRHEHSDPAL